MSVDVNPYINGLFALGGAIIGGLFPIIKDIITTNTQIKIERIKMHDKDKLHAYKLLLIYSKELLDIVKPDNHEYVDDFIHSYKFEGFIEYFPYYSKEIIKKINKLVNLYDCFQMHDIDWIEDPRKKIKNELPTLAYDLHKLIYNDFSKWNT